MTMSNRPPLIDEHGAEHRFGCPMVGWTSRPATLRGWHLLTCPECGAVRLARAGSATTTEEAS